jgi:hypothetical protein
MAETGAKAALHGFRLQGLYTLWRLLTAGSDDALEFVVEGVEDLDVYHGTGRLLERLQVKAYAADLSLSTLGPKKPSSFLRRVTSLPDDGAETRVISFGPIGPELRGAWGGDLAHRKNVTAKLVTDGFSDDEIQRLYDRIHFEVVDAEAIQAGVLSRLQESLMGGNPQTAFDLLLGWMLVAAEAGERITAAVLQERITAVGQYLAERSAHHREWFTSIVPLEDQPVAGERVDELAASFYRGVAAEYEHILAGVDVMRPEPLEEIERAFTGGSRVVIIHGASGQGKSALAYRYLHDYVPTDWRFAVRAVDDRQHALSVATALSGHLRAVGARMYVYVDVSHRDLAWPELVRSLLRQPGIRILVTIREEDLARQALPAADLGFPALVGLDFSRSEAQALYEQLAARRPANAFPRFHDAWERFGEAGPLLEFAFLVTQNETLEDRLAAQVRRLETEVRRGDLPAGILALLHSIVIANAGEARVDLRGLGAALGLDAPAVLVALLEREYLVRTTEDGRYAVALHPIRSAILARILTDPGLSPWQEAAVRAMSHVPETDLESFLLHGFVRGGVDAAALAAAILNRPMTSWSGLAACCRAMLWRSVQEHVERDRPIVEEAWTTFGRAWWVALRSDLFGLLADGEGVLRLMQQLNPGRAAVAEQLRARQAPLATLLSTLAEWLDKQRVEPIAPHSPAEWDGLAETHFWAARAAPDCAVAQWARTYDLTEPVAELPVGALAELVYSLSTGPVEAFEAQVSRHRAAIRARFRRDTATLYIEEDGDLARAHFLVELEVLEGGKHRPLTDEGPSKDRLHDLASERIVLLRLLEPGRERYGSQGYGHRTGIIELPYDPTQNATGADVRYIHPRWLPAANATFHNLMDLPHRPATWLEYAEQILEMRRRTVDSLARLRGALDSHFVSKKPLRILNGVIRMDEWQEGITRLVERPLLPRMVVDDWGFVGDDRSRTGGSSLAPRDADFVSRVRVLGAGLSVERYQGYLSSLRDYAGSLQNFFEQAVPILLLHGFEGYPRNEEQEELLAGYRATVGYDDHKVFLSVHNLSEARRELPAFQAAFNTAFAGLLPGQVVKELSARETDLLDRVWPLYFEFANEPAARVRDRAEMRARLKMQQCEDDLLRRIKSALASLRPGGVQASVRREQPSWEGAGALWVDVDVTGAAQREEVIKTVMTALQTFLGTVTMRSREAFVVTERWPNLVILPLIRGRSHGGAIRISTPPMFERPNVDDEPWRYLPVPIPPPALAQLNLDVDAEPLNAADRLTAALFELVFRFASWSDAVNSPGERDQIALELLEEYVGAHAEVVRTTWERAISALAETKGSTGAIQEVDRERVEELLGFVTNRLMGVVTEDGTVRKWYEECVEITEDLMFAFMALNEARLAGL